MTDFLSAVLLLVGAAFLLLASLGLLRMPDLYMRMSSAAKGSTLGVGCMLLAVGVYFPGTGITARAIAGIGFFFATTPVAAHLIGRAAYVIGVPLWSQAVRDDLVGRYDPVTHELDRGPRAEIAGLVRRRPGPPTVVRVLRRPLGNWRDDDSNGGANGD